jgi:hypothetical protein
MSNSPHFFGLRFIVSEKFKEVFEDLGIKDSYFKQIHLRKFDSNLYLFLNPITDYHVIDFEKSRFFKQVGTERKTLKFNDMEDFIKNKDSYDLVEECFLNDDFKNDDVIYLRSNGLFFSERLLKALEDKNIIGLATSNLITAISR